MEIIQHPGYQELQEYCDLLRNKLLELILERDQLVTVIIPNIETEYQLQIGSLAFERFCRQTEINKSKRIIEIIQTGINRNEDVSIEDIESRLEIEFREWEERLKEHLEAIEAARSRNESRLSIGESRRLAELYRKLVKKLHPDVSPDIYCENRSLWRQVQEAYKNGDLDSIETLWLIVQDIDKDGGRDPGGEMPLFEQLREKETTLKKRIREVREDIADLTSGYPYDLKDKLTDQSWVKREKESLQAELAELAVENSKFKILADQMIGKHCHG